MRAISQISIEGFRRLACVKALELRPLTVLIGANGVGKTSFLDALSLLAQSASGELSSRLSDFSGINSILTRGIADQLLFDVESPVPAREALKYRIQLRPLGQGHEIALETLSQHIKKDKPGPLKTIDSKYERIRYHNPRTGKLEPPTWVHDSAETSLSQVPKMYRQCEDFRSKLASLAYYSAMGFDTSRKAQARLPQQMRPAELPGATGEDIVSCLFYMREGDRSRYDAVEASLSAVFPSFERLDFPPVAAGTLAMTWKDRDFSKPIYMHELSDGTLRFLWLVTLLQSPGLTEITLIDEPEVSLHPAMMQLLVDLFRETSEHTQVIVATQSERLVRFLKPEEVLVCDAADGSADDIPAGWTTMNWADSLDLDKWLEDYALDELWRLGRIGGRP